ARSCSSTRARASSTRRPSASPKISTARWGVYSPSATARRASDSTCREHSPARFRKALPCRETLTGKKRDARYHRTPMPKILVVHGAGMNMRGKSQVDIFGPLTLAQYDEHIRRYARELDCEVEL